MGGRRSIEFNADCGEGFGVYSMPAQVWRAELARGGPVDAPPATAATAIAAYLQLVSCVNLACGFHAGDPLLIKEYIAIARRCGCRIGAHVSFPDLGGFGNRFMEMEPSDLKAAIQYQIAALAGLARMTGERLTHVKPHGALYNRSMTDGPLAQTVAESVAEYDASLAVYGLPGSAMDNAAHETGLRFVPEAFSDRAYQKSGALVDRTSEGAMVLDPSEVADRVVGMVREGRVRSVEGEWIEIRPRTISFHSDTPGSWEILRRCVDALCDAGIEIAGVAGSEEP